MTNPYLHAVQVEEINKLIDQLGVFKMNKRVAPVFGGVDNLRRYFNVQVNDWDDKLELTRLVPTGDTYFEQYCTSLSSDTIIVNGNTTTATGMVVTHPEGNRMEHHIDRQKLIEVVTANKQRYTDQYDHLKELYEAELAEKLHAHVEGEIPQNHIMVLDKKGNRFEMPVDRSDIYDTMLRELELDVREVVILDDQDYGPMVENTSSNLRNIEDAIKMLEEL